MVPGGEMVAVGEEWRPQTEKKGETKQNSCIFVIFLLK